MNFNNGKYSIIVPVYNAEKYLERCIESVLFQIYTNWELILVDDGSTDGSWKLISKYISIDDRIRAIQQDNSGPGAARNNGICEAKGEWIVFLDSDDYLSKEYLSIAKEYSRFDVVYIDFLQVNESGKPIKSECMSRYSNIPREQFVRSMMTGKIPWGGHRKIVRSDILKENNILFSTTRNGEEAVYSFRLMQATNNIGFISEKPIYMYTIRGDSLSHTASTNPLQCAYDDYKEYLKTNSLYEKYAATLNAFNVYSSIVAIDRIVQIKTGKDRKKLLKETVERYQLQRDKNYTIDSLNLAPRVRVFIPFIDRGIVLPVIIASNLKRMLK